MNDYLIQQSQTYTKFEKTSVLLEHENRERKKKAKPHTQRDVAKEKKKMTPIRFGTDKQEIIM